MSAVTPADAAAARRLAASILRERRFHPASVPRPLHGLLHDIGSVLLSPGRAIASLVKGISVGLPGGLVTGWILVVLLLGGAIATVTRRYSRAALAIETQGSRDDGAGREQRAADLERAAGEAERDGRFAEAVRLRFRAGLERLGEQGTITGPRSTPTADVARRLGSAEFDGLARRFDEIAYGAAPAGEADAEQARSGWRRVIKTASRA